MNRLFSNKIVVAILSILVSGALASLIISTNSIGIKLLLKSFGLLGLFTIIWLHMKSFFSAEDLGWYYTRLYGAGIGLIYTSIIFALFVYFYVGQTNEVFNIAALTTVFSTALYNFCTNNYLGVEKEHLVARKVLEKQMEEDERQKKLKKEKLKEN